MLSATPVNNRFNDLRNQLALAYEGESENLRSKLSIADNIEEIFRRAQAAFNDWSKLPAEQRTHRRRFSRCSDFDFFELLDAVTIARSAQAHPDVLRHHGDRRVPRATPAEVDSQSPLTTCPTCPRSTRSSSSSSRSPWPSTRHLAYVFPSRSEVRTDSTAVQNRHARAPTSGTRPRAGTPETHDRQPPQAPGEFGRGVPATYTRQTQATSTRHFSPSRTRPVGSRLASLIGDLEADDDDFEVPTGGTVGTRVKIDLQRPHHRADMVDQADLGRPTGRDAVTRQRVLLGQLQAGQHGANDWAAVGGHQARGARGGRPGARSRP